MNSIKKSAFVLLLLLAFWLLAACGRSAAPSTPTGQETSEANAPAPAPEPEPAPTPAQEPDAIVESAEVPEQEPEAEQEPIELIVFAAASMTETLGRVAENYKSVAPNVTVTCNFESSGTLKTQIEEGADCDVFISAAPKQINELDISQDETVNAQRLDFVEQGTRKNLLENKVALVVPAGNPKEIKDFADLADRLAKGDILFAMGNSDVPVGQYTQKILAYFELDEEKLAKSGVITYGTNVKEVTTQVSEASVDCGVVYATDAFSANLSVVDTATKEMCGQVIYPVAVMKNSKQIEAAKAFVEYLGSAEAMEVFKSVGFSEAQ